MAINEIDFIKTTSSKLEEVQEEYPESFIHVHDKKDESVVNDALYIGACRVTDNFNIGDMNEGLSTLKVGGLESTTIGELKNKSMSEIMMNILCPLTYPTRSSNPSISLSYSGSKLIEVGETLPSKEDIRISTNSGKWSDGTDYAGTCGEVTLTMTPDEWGNPSTERSYSITGRGTFAAGPMSKDSHGGDYQSYGGGDVTSSAVTIKAVYPFYINTRSITEMTKQSLIDYNTLQTITVEVPAEVDGTLDKFQIWLPYAFSTLTVKQFNPVSGKYDINVNMVLMDGEVSKYIRTKDVTNTNTGAVKYEIKIKK